VTAQVFPVWWNYNGGGDSLHGSRHPWRFVIEEDEGWRVTAVTMHAWFGGYVRPEACRCLLIY
jgi:hypothetical protein